ncbi:MAG: recombinase RecT [Candidatus Cohnella colombiensis]|uniref:Recombinase RecT n=1 Tax=Candidatus Cohnella colombiensis TaxID=3121368 RepID=A0AA95EUS2_9BACL|nr:MAG: recombinase RecT [Cohnella sp.]
MSTQLQTVDINQLQQIGEFGVAELMTMKETIGKDLSIPQFNLFMYQCNRMGLDPALKHAFPILYGGKLDSRVSYEGLLSLAKKSEGFQGVYNQVVCDNEIDDFEAETDDEGVITKINHKIKFPRGKVVGAYSIAKREGKKNVIILMDVMEVQKMLKGQNQKFWKMDDGSPDPDMFKKHVGFRSIKAQYDIASVVEDHMESMNGVDSIDPYAPTERKDITEEANALNKQPTKTETKQPPKTTTPPADDDLKPLDDEQPTTPPVDQEAVRLLKDIEEAFVKLGIHDKDKRAEYTSGKAKFKNGKPTVADLKALLKVMKLEIEEMEQATQANGAGPFNDLPLE